MPQNSPTSPAAWAALCLPLLLVLAACLLGIGDEEAVRLFFEAWRAANPGLARLVRLYTDWGNPALYLVFAALLVKGLKERRADLAGRALAYLAAQLLVSLALERLLKIAIGRPRPGVGGPFVPWSLDAAHNAMPSGHTAEMTLQTAALLPLARPLAQPLLLGLSLALMGASRIILGAHHPSDVLGGLCLGLFGGWLAQRLVPPVERRLSKHLHAKGDV